MMSTDFRPRTPIPMADLEQRRIYDEIGLGEFEEIKPRRVVAAARRAV